MHSISAQQDMTGGEAGVQAGSFTRCDAMMRAREYLGRWRLVEANAIVAWALKAFLFPGVVVGLVAGLKIQLVSPWPNKPGHSFLMDIPFVGPCHRHALALAHPPPLFFLSLPGPRRVRGGAHLPPLLAFSPRPPPPGNGTDEKGRAKGCFHC